MKQFTMSMFVNEAALNKAKAEYLVKECERLEAANTKLEAKIEKVYEAGHWGIGHVFRMNDVSHEIEASDKLAVAMYG